MSRGVNKVIIVGNIGNDPETRYSAGGTCITSISVATSESWKDKTTGEKQEKTEWHKITFFGRLAEIAGEYLKKGSQVYIEGSLRTESYEKEGITRYITKIIANEMQMLGGKPQGEGGGQRDSGSHLTRAQRGEPRGPARGPQSAPSRGPAPIPNSGFDEDDIPF